MKSDVDIPQLKAVKIRIPTTLRVHANNLESFMVNGDTVKDCLNLFETTFPNVVGPMRDSNGNLRRSVNIYLNDEDIRFLSGEETPVNEDAEISIVPAIAGG